MLKEHDYFSLYLDRDSAANVTVDGAAKFNEYLESWDVYEDIAQE